MIKKNNRQNRLSSVFNQAAFFIDPLLNFIYPPVCVLCDNRAENNSPLCTSCHKMISGTAKPVFETEIHHFHYLDEKLYFDGIYHFWDFTPEIHCLIHHLKYHHGKKLGILLGHTIGELWNVSDGFPDTDLIIPVPLHPVRKRERGFNQSEQIAIAISDQTNIPLKNTLLTRNRHTKTQTRLNAEKRQENVRNAFNINAPELINDKNILLTDDVSTTGATLNSAAKTLKSAGASHVFGCTLARPTLTEMIYQENILNI